MQLIYKKTTFPKLPMIILVSLLFFLFLLSQFPIHRKTTAHSNSFTDLRIRHGYTSYDTYIERQLNKTLNPKLRKIWTTRDWDRKVHVFSAFFDDETFDFEFSNVFDHALYPWKFVGEIQRTLKSGGVCVLHVALSRRTDKYSANDLYSVGPLVELFNGSDLVEVSKVDGFGLDTEVVFRKKIK